MFPPVFLQTHLHTSDMAYCGPSYAIPSCASSPVVGFGSAGFGSGSGLGYGSLAPTGVPSASLGVLSGVEPSCINQIPPAEVVLQPPPVVMTIPGPILSATGEPVSVGGNTPCAVSYGSNVVVGGSLGGGALGGGSFGRGYFSGGRSSLLGRRGSSCYPCN